MEAALPSRGRQTWPQRASRTRGPSSQARGRARQPPVHLTNGAGGLRLQRRDGPRAGSDPTLGSGPPSAVSRAQEWGQHPGVPRSRAHVTTVGVPGPAPQQGHPTGPLLSRQKTALPTSLDLSDPWPAGTSNHVRGRPSGDVNSDPAGMRRLFRHVLETSRCQTPAALSHDGAGRGRPRARQTEGSGASGAVPAGSRSARQPCCTRGPNPCLSQALGAVGSLLTLPGAHLAAGAALTRRAHEACHP